MDPKNYKTDDERKFYQNIEKFTDRELQEKQAYCLEQINKNTLHNLFHGYTYMKIC